MRNKDAIGFYVTIVTAFFLGMSSIVIAYLALRVSERSHELEKAKNRPSFWIERAHNRDGSSYVNIILKGGIARVSGINANIILETDFTDKDNMGMTCRSEPISLPLRDISFGTPEGRLATVDIRDSDIDKAYSIAIDVLGKEGIRDAMRFVPYNVGNDFFLYISVQFSDVFGNLHVSYISGFTQFGGNISSPTEFGEHQFRHGTPISSPRLDMCEKVRSQHDGGW